MNPETAHMDTGKKRQVTINKRKTRKKKNSNSFWILITIVFGTTCIFIIPQLHLERFLNINHLWWFDIVQHVIFFFFLCLILFRLLWFQKLTFSFFLFIFFCSVLIEIIQKILYEGPFEYMDVAGNLIGIGSAFITVRLAHYFQIHSLKQRVQQQKKEMMFKR